MEGNTIKYKFYLLLAFQSLTYFVDFTRLHFYLKGRVKYYNILLVIMMQCDLWSGWDEVLVELVGWLFGFMSMAGVPCLHAFMPVPHSIRTPPNPTPFS